MLDKSFALFPNLFVSPNAISTFGPLRPYPTTSTLSLHSLSISVSLTDYVSKLAISWLLYRHDVSPCPRVHQVGFLLLHLVKPKLTAGLVWVLLDLTKGLGIILMWVNLVWFIAGLSKKINGGSFESKSWLVFCTYLSSLWFFFLWLSLLHSHSLPPFSCLLLAFFFLSFSQLRGELVISSVCGILLLYWMDFSFSLAIHHYSSNWSPDLVAHPGWQLSAYFYFRSVLPVLLLLTSSFLLYK